ncbi:MAG: LD-carboxypeptidase [Acidobacteriota bacterium]|jgi:muramoyltetrapeptide carboxypeptidase|nr:LD-carboxypeptidase [Acidobacteriota bacterium]
MPETNAPQIKPKTKPRALRPGDTIAIVAPAGPIASREPFDRGVATLERLGFRVRFDDRVFQSVRYLAGCDADRAEELTRAVQDPSVQAIMALRGGYGSARLIPLLDERRLRPHPKIFMGFSDLMTLHLLFNKWGWITFHGPMAANTAFAEMTEDQTRHLVSLWTDLDYRPTLRFAETKPWASGAAEGVLTGGCLSLVAASLGTAYEIETEGRILFLEDVGEPPYRIDRMITHLRLAGKLDAAAGILLGQFRACEPSQGGYAIADVLQDVLSGLAVPILADFPAGHGRDNWALPLGVRVRLDADAQTLRFLESAVA